MGETGVAFHLFMLFLLLDIAALAGFIGIALHRDRKKLKEETIKQALLYHKDVASLVPEKKRRKRILLGYLKVYRDLCQSVRLPEERMDEIVNFFCGHKLDIHIVRMLSFLLQVRPEKGCHLPCSSAQACKPKGPYLGSGEGKPRFGPPCPGVRDRKTGKQGCPSFHHRFTLQIFPHLRKTDSQSPFRLEQCTGRLFPGAPGQEGAGNSKPPFRALPVSPKEPLLGISSWPAGRTESIYQAGSFSGTHPNLRGFR